MADIVISHAYALDLDSPALEVRLHRPLMHQDAQADMFIVRLSLNGADADLAGMSVIGWLWHATTNQTIPLEGNVIGSTACITLPEECYSQPGLFSLAMQLIDGNVRRTLLKADGMIARTSSSCVIDPAAVVPDLPGLLGKIAAMEQATADAREAAAAASVLTDDVAANSGGKVEAAALPFGYLRNINRPSLWVQGGSQGDGGIVGEDSPYYHNRISTRDYLTREDFDALHAVPPFQVNVFQFAEDGSFLGETGNYYNIHISEMPYMAYCKLQVRNGDAPDELLDPSAGRHVLIMTEPDCNAAYERGDINSTTGEDVAISGGNWWTRLRTRGFADEVSSLMIDDGYRLGLYVYDKDSLRLIDYRTIDGPVGFRLSDAYRYRLVFFRSGNGVIMYDDISHYGLNAYQGSQSWTNLAHHWQNGYVDADGTVQTANDVARNKTITTTDYISKTVRFVTAVSPYVVAYHQYDGETGAYIGTSDYSRLLVLPDQGQRYRISMRNALGYDGPDTWAKDYTNLTMIEAPYPTRYGNAAYFAPFDGMGSYYPGHQADYGRFSRSTTTAELYAALDELIASADGYITKTVLGKDSSGQQDLIRLDCVESGVDATRTDRANLPKIVIVAGQHGGEKCSCYSLYYWLKDMIETWQQDGRLEYVRYHCHLIIIPVANPWGFDHVAYHNYNNVNLNRNYVANWDGSGNGGSGPLSEPETQIIAALVRKERGAVYLADYHCNGDGGSLPADKAARPNWHSLLQTGDVVHDSIGTASKVHIDNISRHWWQEYAGVIPDKAEYGSCGSVDTGYWETGLPTLQGYASRNGIIANTFEGLNGFTDREGFGAEGAEACTKLIGNWIPTVLAHFARYFDISVYERDLPQIDRRKEDEDA